MPARAAFSLPRYHRITNFMTLKAREKLGEELIGKYQTRCSNDKYAAAVDVIADVLLGIAQSDSEATQILHAAEVEFRNAAESESFVSEG
jgi:hypothetical protein